MNKDILDSVVNLESFFEARPHPSDQLLSNTLPHTYHYSHRLESMFLECDLPNEIFYRRKSSFEPCCTAYIYDANIAKLLFREPYSILKETSTRKIMVIDFLKEYIIGFILGKQRFDKEFSPNTAIMYGENKEIIVKRIKKIYFNQVKEHIEKKGLGYINGLNEDGVGDIMPNVGCSFIRRHVVMEAFPFSFRSYGYMAGLTYKIEALAEMYTELFPDIIVDKHFHFENNVDKRSSCEVYIHFFSAYVNTGLMSLSTFHKWLKAAFDKRVPLKDKLHFEGDGLTAKDIFTPMAEWQHNNKYKRRSDKQIFIKLIFDFFEIPFKENSVSGNWNTYHGAQPHAQSE